MPLKDLSLLASAVLDLIQPGTLSDGALFKLQCVIPENLLTSALDLIDRENVVKLTTPWGRTEYQILGSAAIHTVILEPRNNYMPSYCSCSAFAHLVLEPDPHFMCEHVLAARIASRMLRFVERMMGPDEIAAVVFDQHIGV